MNYILLGWVQVLSSYFWTTYSVKFSCLNGLHFNFLSSICLHCSVWSVHDLTISVNCLEQVESVKGDDVVCKIKNSATLAGSMFTLHVCQVRIEMPTLSEKDKEVCDTFNRCIMKLLLLLCFCLGSMYHFYYM